MDADIYSLDKILSLIIQSGKNNWGAEAVIGKT